MSLALLQPQLNALLNANAVGAYSTTSVDDRRTAAEQAEALKDADAEFFRAYAETDTNGRRSSLATLTTFGVSGAKLPAHIGQITNIEIQGADNVWRRGKTAPAAKIQRWIDNLGGIYATTRLREGYYALENEVLVYSGQSARGLLVNYVRGAELQSPDEAAAGVLALAYALCNKEGDELQRAVYYKSVADGALASVRQGQAIVSNVDQMEMTR